MSELADIRGSIAIIGGGAAGITLAIELADHFKDVLILESGATEYEEQTQDLYSGKVLGHTQPDLRISRLRFLGGATNHWLGRCAPLDLIDFERLPDRPYSGWPFGFATLIPFYNRAYRYCQINILKQGIPNVDATTRKLFQGSELQLTEFRYSPPTLFGEEYRSMLDSSDRIKVYLNANVTNIGANEAKRAIQFLEVRTLNGRMLTVTAKAFVLCCGGIENARILLNCTSDFATGLGNQHDLVGRFFMDHLLTTAGFIVPQFEIHDLGPFDLHNRSSHALMNSAETVQQPGRRGCSLFMYPIDDVQTVEAIPSYQAIRQIVRYAKRGALTPDFGKVGCTALEEPQAIVRVLYNRLRATGAVQSISVAMEGEQSPNPASRVTLSDDVDALGMRRVVLDWQIDPLDGSNLFKTAQELARNVGAAGFGRMLVNLIPGDELSQISGNHHHMGTTRMHDDPRKGVVNQHCAVHGLSNLYIAGSSVFPTGGRVNPTLTLLALAIRLADHLELTVE